MAIVNYEGLVTRERPFKKMLEYYKSPTTGEVQISINYSSLELMQTCMRKAQYTLQDGWRGSESEALIFGSAVHQGIEVWYIRPRSQRTRVSSVCMDYQVTPYLEDRTHAETCARCASIDAFKESGAPLKLLSPDNKRSLENGTEILNGYFDEYLNDPFEVMETSEGRPMIEIHAEARIHEEPGLVIDYHGTLDIVFKDVVNGDVFVGDHKTTWQLGKDFYNRLKPNHQYTGYVWLANQVLGLNTNRFMVNGIQVAKTKRALARQFTERNEDDFKELKDAVVFNVKKWLECKESDTFPQNSPNPCTMYGGCSFREVCDLPFSMRDQALALTFERAQP